MIKQKIFISSVQGEFQNERKQIADYIRHDALLSFYFEPFLFEELPAQDRSAQAAYLEQAAKSEIYLLLLGSQYGYQDALDHTDGLQESGQRLPQKTREILELLKKNPYITRKELSSLLHIAPSAIQKHIEKLKKGYIRRVGPDKGGHWEIIPTD